MSVDYSAKLVYGVYADEIPNVDMDDLRQDEDHEWIHVDSEYHEASLENTVIGYEVGIDEITFDKHPFPEEEKEFMEKFGVKPRLIMYVLQW